MEMLIRIQACVKSSLEKEECSSKEIGDCVFVRLTELIFERAEYHIWHPTVHLGMKQTWL